MEKGRTMSQSSGRNVYEADRIRIRAISLLELLISERAMLERMLTEAGRRDPLKYVTGRSSLDNAITTTRHIVRAIEEMVGPVRYIGRVPIGSPAPARVSAGLNGAAAAREDRIGA